MVAIVFDKDTQDTPADLDFARIYVDRYNIPFRTGIDPNRFNMYKYFDLNATPYTMVVSREKMTIEWYAMGWDYGNASMKASMQDLLDQLLGE